MYLPSVLHPARRARQSMKKRLLRTLCLAGLAAVTVVGMTFQMAAHGKGPQPRSFIYDPSIVPFEVDIQLGNLTFAIPRNYIFAARVSDGAYKDIRIHMTRDEFKPPTADDMGDFSEPGITPNKVMLSLKYTELDIEKIKEVLADSLRSYAAKLETREDGIAIYNGHLRRTNKNNIKIYRFAYRGYEILDYCWPALGIEECSAWYHGESGLAVKVRYFTEIESASKHIARELIGLIETWSSKTDSTAN